MPKRDSHYELLDLTEAYYYGQALEAFPSLSIEITENAGEPYVSSYDGRGRVVPEGRLRVRISHLESTMKGFYNAVRLVRAVAETEANEAG